MKNIILGFAALFAIFLIITNFTYVHIAFPQSDIYRFCANKCEYEDWELGGGHDPFGSVLDSFEGYKSKTNNNNLVLYRRFQRHWWQVWNWYDYCTHPRWGCPYAEKDEDT